MMKFLRETLRRFPSLYAAASGVYRHRTLTRPLVETPFGIRLAGSAEMEQGSFEPEETALVLELLDEITVFINVGANIGYYSLLARSRDCSVVAIEPFPRNVLMLTRNAIANGWSDIEVIPMGVGPKPSLLKIYGGGTAASFVEGWAGAPKDHFEIVSVSTLDNVIGERFRNHRVMIMIDVEGFELGVLQGAQGLLRRCPAPVWFIEICISEHQPAGTISNPHLISTFEQFWENGYECKIASKEDNPVSQADVRSWAEGKDLPQSHNFIFTKKS